MCPATASLEKIRQWSLLLLMLGPTPNPSPPTFCEAKNMHTTILFKHLSVLLVFIFPSVLQAKCPLFSTWSLAKCLSDLVPHPFGRGTGGQLWGNGARTRKQPQLHRLKAPDDPTINCLHRSYFRASSIYPRLCFSSGKLICLCWGCGGPLSPRCNFIPLVPLSGLRLVVID